MSSAMHAGGSATVIPATAAPMPVAAPRHGQRPDTMVCQAYADHYTCVTADMADRMARIEARRNGTADGTPHVYSTTPGKRPGRDELTRKLGADMASQLGWNPTDHTPEELAAVGEQLIVDYTLHGDEASSARLLLTLARAAGALDPAMDTIDRDKVADRISLFLKAEFKDELAISQALAALLGLRIPTRQELAHELLRKIGLDPERKVDIPQLVDPENPLATNEAKKAGDHYFNRDKLSGEDIRGMSDRPLSDAEVVAHLAALPDSLDTLFAQRFDAYTQAAADKTVKLIDSWLAWICKKHGAKPGETGIEISSARLQYYWPEVHPLHWTSQVRRNGRTRIEVPAGGYIATVHAAGGSCRYFLSTTDGSAFPLPADADIREWLSQHQGLVFGDPPAGTGQDRSPNNRMRTRVVLDTLGRGKHSDLSSLLIPVLRGRFDKARENARGQTPAEQAIDSLLDCIPFRRMIVASRDGDENTAVMAGTIDVLTFAIPMLSAKLRLAAGAARGLAPAVRSLARGGIRAGIADLRGELANVPGLRGSIKTALRSLNTAPETAHELRPLDADRMAAALKPRHPGLARAVEQAAAQTRGPRIRDDWWRIVHTPATADDAGITALEEIEARGRDGGKLSLLPYGGSNRRAYTTFDPATRRRTGYVLQLDPEGWLCPALPYDTLVRYRVSALKTLSDLASRQVGADGAVHLNGKTYARIVDEHVEIAREPGSTAWRVIPPRTARRDIVTHRLFHDKAKGLWREADMPGLKGGGNTEPLPGGSSQKRPLAGDTSETAEGEPSPKRNEPQAPPAGGANAAALPALAPSARQLSEFNELLAGRIRGTASPQQIDATKKLLAGLAADPRGKAILSALRAHHELRGELPEIVLVDSTNNRWSRPSLAHPISSRVWHLDLDALNTGSRQSAAQELGAVYNNMTGVLQGGNRYADVLARSEPRLPAELEEAWARWIAEDSGHAAATNPHPSLPSPSQATIDYLRSQLQQALCYGGMDRNSLIALLKGGVQDELGGLRINLSNRALTRLPPMPGDVYGLNISNNPIQDWSALSPNLKVLDAPRTSRTVLEHLPVELEELNISNNALETLPGEALPRTLKSLICEGNQLTEVHDLPESLHRIMLAGNAIRRCPENLPRGLRKLDLSACTLENLSMDLPPALEELWLTENELEEIPPGCLPEGLLLLDLGENGDIRALPALPERLQILMIESTGLTSLPENLPPLRKLYADDLGLRRLPDTLPPTLIMLSVQDNELTELPACIASLSGDVHLEGNPLTLDRLPLPPAGRRGPRFHLSSTVARGRPHANSANIAQAVRSWLNPQTGEAAQRWDAIGRSLEGAHGDTLATTQFRVFLDRLRDTIHYDSAECRAGIAEWLSELSKPERKPLLESTLQMCAGATARCDDRVALTLDQLRKLRLHDDIRIGRYNKRPADALKAMRELFVLRRLGDSADRKIAALRALGEAVDEVEVRLAYTVKLRQALELSIVVPDMYFFNHSKVTQADLGAALAEVLEAVRTDFYKDLVVDDTWRALLAQERAEAYAAAQGRLQEMSDEVLNQRIRSELESRGLSPDDLDAQRNIGPVVWRDMEYEILEPLTREYLESAGVALPGQRRRRRMLKPARPMSGPRLDRSRQTPDHARADRRRPAATGEPYDRRHAAGAKPG